VWCTYGVLCDGFGLFGVEIGVLGAEVGDLLTSSVLLVLF